jgi:hypothetical protein
MRGHPKYILLVISYTFNYFTCTSSSSVRSTHKALEKIIVVTVCLLCFWLSLSVVHHAQGINSARIRYCFATNDEMMHLQIVSISHSQ